jgi:hypothetical protein
MSINIRITKCLHVPYSSLTMYLTHNQAERDSITSFRNRYNLILIYLFAKQKVSLNLKYRNVF